MLISREGEQVFAIGQLSHAWLAGQLARAWGNTRFGAVDRAEEAILGAEQHDIGWTDFDRNPPLNPNTGLPPSFVEVTVDDHLSIWRHAPDKLMSQSAYAALLVSLHAAWVSQLRAMASPDRAAELQAHIDDERARAAGLCAALRVSEEERERVRRQLLTWDRISLALCHGWGPSTIEDVPAAESPVAVDLARRPDDTWAVEPWPFRASAVEVQCEARPLDGTYEDERSMQRAFAAAIPVTLEFVLHAT